MAATLNSLAQQLCAVKIQVENEILPFQQLKSELLTLQSEINSLTRLHSQLRDQVKITKNESLELNDSNFL